MFQEQPEKDQLYPAVSYALYVGVKMGSKS